MTKNSIFPARRAHNIMVTTLTDKSSRIIESSWL